MPSAESRSPHRGGKEAVTLQPAAARTTCTEAINGLIERHRRVARGFRNCDNYRPRNAAHRRRTQPPPQVGRAGKAGSTPSHQVRRPRSFMRVLHGFDQLFVLSRCVWPLPQWCSPRTLSDAIAHSGIGDIRGATSSAYVRSKSLRYTRDSREQLCRYSCPSWGPCRSR